MNLAALFCRPFMLLVALLLAWVCAGLGTPAAWAQSPPPVISPVFPKNPHAHEHAFPQVLYFHNDYLGSPALITDDEGRVYGHETYLPFGQRMGDPWSLSENSLWFTGKPVDHQTGLSYFGARYYSSVMGRFMGVDPAEVDEKNLHSFNRYAYGNNNPYKYVDPDGRYAELAFEALSLSMGYMSFRDNLRAGNTGAAIADGVGMLADIAGAALPGVPGVAGLGIRASREAAAAAGAAAAKETRTLFHYTDDAGAKAIAESGVLRPDAKGRVFLTDQRLSPGDVKDRLFIGRSGDKGSHVVEIQVPGDLPIRQGKNPNELIHQGAVRDGRQGTFTVKQNDF